MIISGPRWYAAEEATTRTRTPGTNQVRCSIEPKVMIITVSFGVYAMPVSPLGFTAIQMFLSYYNGRSIHLNVPVLLYHVYLGTVAYIQMFLCYYI